MSNFFQQFFIRESDPKDILLICGENYTESEITDQYGTMCKNVDDYYNKTSDDKKSLARARLRDARDYLLHQIGKLGKPLPNENFFHRIKPIVDELKSNNNQRLKPASIESLKQLITQDPSIVNLSVDDLSILGHAIQRNMQDLAKWLATNGATLFTSDPLDTFRKNPLDIAVLNNAWWFCEHLTEDSWFREEQLIKTLISATHNEKVVKKVLTHYYAGCHRPLSPELKAFIIEKDPKYIPFLEQRKLISPVEANPLKAEIIIGNPELYGSLSLDDRKQPYYITALLAQMKEKKESSSNPYYRYNQLIDCIPLNELPEELARAFTCVFSEQLKTHKDFKKYAPWPYREETLDIIANLGTVAIIASVIALLAGWITAATCGHVMLGALAFVAVSAVITAISQSVLKCRNPEVGQIEELLNQHGMFKSKSDASADSVKAYGPTDDEKDSDITLASLAAVTA